jgi:hypothetical protein
MARKAPSKCIAVMVGGAIGGFVTGVGCGAAIEAIPSVNDSLSTLIAFAIPLVPGLLTSGGAAYAAWGSTPACDNDKKPPDNGGSGSQIERSQEQRVIVVLVVMFLAVLLPQLTRLLFGAVPSQQVQLIVQVVMVAIAFCIWVIGTFWLYNQGVAARRRREELPQLGTLEQTGQKTQPGVSVRDETILKKQVFDLTEGFLVLRRTDLIATFRAVWEEKLRTLPLATLWQLQQVSAVSRGLGFAGESEELLPVVSTISWAVANWSSLSQTPNTEERIVEEAKARGCPWALSFALAHYLQEHLTRG